MAIPLEIFIGPVIGFVLFYGAASMIKNDVIGLERPQDRALFALKGLGILFALAFFAWATGIWKPS